MRIKIILFLGLSLLFCGASYSGYRVIVTANARESIKEDYSLTNSVTFGLFSVDQWRDRLFKVVEHQIQVYHPTLDQKKDIRKAIGKALHRLVSKTIGEINQPQKSLAGKLKKLVFNAIADSSKLQAQVQPFTNVIVAKVSSPESQSHLKAIAGSKISEMIHQTYDSTSTANYVVTKYVYKKYQASDPFSFNQVISHRLKECDKNLMTYIVVMLACVFAALLFWWVLRKQAHLQNSLFVFALLFALVLLVVGSAVPIIEVDARISSLDLLIIKEKVHFENQVLFYQSKSIIGIIYTLLGQKKPDAIVVGILMLLFILILPLIRLIFKGIYISCPATISGHPVVRYITFESTKWDMADVMVVAIVMTYIGLNGILKSQLKGLNTDSDTLHIVTANNTSLQPGYFIFVGYVLFAMLLSYVLNRLSKSVRLNLGDKN